VMTNMGNFLIRNPRPMMLILAHIGFHLHLYVAFLPDSGQSS
jgi:hypothetical protein